MTSYSLEKLTTDDVIAECKAKSAYVGPSTKITAVCSCEDLWEKKLKYASLYNEKRLNKLCSEVMHLSISYSTYLY